MDDVPNIDLSQALDCYQTMLAIEGDRRAFELLYTRWHPRLLRYAIRLMGDQELGQDVMQDAAMAISGNIHRLKDANLFGPWAYTIVRRRAADQIKTQTKIRQMNTDIAAQPETEAHSSMEDHLTLTQVLQTLPNADRDLLTLSYVYGMANGEIATCLSIPLGTVKSRLFAARQKLKNAYIQQGDQNV